MVPSISGVLSQHGQPLRTSTLADTTASGIAWSRPSLVSCQNTATATTGHACLLHAGTSLRHRRVPSISGVLSQHGQPLGTSTLADTPASGIAWSRPHGQPLQTSTLADTTASGIAWSRPSLVSCQNTATATTGHACLLHAGTSLRHRRVPSISGVLSQHSQPLGTSRLAGTTQSLWRPLVQSGSGVLSE